MPHDDRTELKYQIALTLAPAIGPITARNLIREVGSASEVFRQKREELQKIKGIGPQLSLSLNLSTLLRDAEQELQFLENHRLGILSFEDQGYPRRLNLCPDGPVVLYTRGEAGLNARYSLSVVGTRRATAYGREMCRRIIQELAEMVEDLSIISGLAYGIDIMAHKTALEMGIPTVAVLAHGMTTLYPYAHREVARKISNTGALVTDFPAHMGPERNNFLRRNRIIAGMGDATLVVESAERGGSLITASMAASYERDVLAVPGRTNDNRSKGCNVMIRDSMAALVQSGEDVIRHLNWHEGLAPPARHHYKQITATAEEKHLLGLINLNNGMDPDDLSHRTGIPIHRVLALLLEMELKHWVFVEPGNRYYGMTSLL